MVIHTIGTTLVQKLLQVKLQETPRRENCADCSMQISGKWENVEFVGWLVVGDQWLVVGDWLVCWLMVGNDWLGCHWLDGCWLVGW